MSLFENFPYTNLHELNLDWLITQLNKISESAVLSVNGETGVVILYQNAVMSLPAVPEDHWSIIRTCDGTSRGIMFGNDNTAYIVHGGLMNQIYSVNNQPPYPVTSVNGQTGAITLYSEQYVRLPDLTDAQMTNWTIFRNLNNVSRGIQFDDDGTAYIIDGVNRYQLYTANNQPNYPVSSVNGQTGSVVLFTDSSGTVKFPDEASGTEWSIERKVNGTKIALVMKNDGDLAIKIGNTEYDVYTVNNPPEMYVDDPTEEVQEVTESSTADYWGLLRETTEGKIGIVFSNTDPDNPEVYLAYEDSNQQGQTLQLLTPAQIPPSSVVSVNGQSGLVVLKGSDLDVSATDSRKVDVAIEDAQESQAYVETGANASTNYAKGTYIIWQNQLYIAKTAIAFGDAFSSSNLDSVDNLGTVVSVLNEKTNFASISGNITYNESYNSTWTHAYKMGQLIFIEYMGESKTHDAGDQIFELASGYRPSANTVFPFVVNAGAYGNIQLGTDGKAKINQISDNTVSGRIYFNAVFRTA